MNSQKMDLKATVVFGEAPESDDDTSSIVTVCHIVLILYHIYLFIHCIS